MKKTRVISLIIAVVVVLTVLLIDCVEIVPVGSTGILLTFGRVEEGKTLSEGLHLKLPFVQEIVSLDNRVQKLELNTEAFSRDIQTVSATLAVNYRLQPEKSFSIYKNAGQNFEQNIIVPSTHEVLKSVCASYNAEELISKRGESSDKMRDELDEKLNEMGITIIDFNIIDFDFSEEYINAVEAKQVAEQVKKRSAIENETAIAQAEREKQISIKQSEADAEKLRISAEAQAQATLIAAQAEADAMKLSSDAEAYRLENVGKLITEPMIQKTIAENWDGKLPTVVGSNANILDITSMLNEENE